MPLDLDGQTLTFTFPEIHEEAVLHVTFHRTLRVPDDGQQHYLPPGLGSFPMRDIADLGERAPEAWRKRGGVVLPMWQAEACWVSFSSPDDYPMAVKVAAGKINAVNGTPWTDALNYEDQDYMEVPGQPWLDGFCVAKGVVRQFVAMPLGKGYTAEGQITGVEEFGGVQLLVRPLKATVWEKRKARLSRSRASHMNDLMDVTCSSPVFQAMGLAPGGAIRQQINEAEEKPQDWAPAESRVRCFVHIANSEQWAQLTGTVPPTLPPTASQYASAGLPWFDFYSDKPAINGTSPLSKLQTVKTIGANQGELPLGHDETFDLPTPVVLGKTTTVAEKPDADW